MILKIILSRRKGISIIEYTILLVIIMTAVLFSQRYILRNFAGRWKQVGDSFGLGRQFDPKRTLECAWSTEQNLWYGTSCFDDQARLHYQDNYNNCFQSCVSSARTYGVCGGASACNRNFFCCQAQCQKKCKEPFVTSCTSPGGIPCGD